MKNFTSALTIVLVLIFLSGIASGKRVEAHMIVKRYWQHDFALGRGPTQSIIILLNGSSKAEMCCKLALGSLIRFSYHLTSVAGFAVLRNIRFQSWPVEMIQNLVICLIYPKMA